MVRLRKKHLHSSGSWLTTPYEDKSREVAYIAADVLHGASLIVGAAGAAKGAAGAAGSTKSLNTNAGSTYLIQNKPAGIGDTIAVLSPSAAKATLDSNMADTSAYWQKQSMNRMNNLQMPFAYGGYIPNLFNGGGILPHRFDLGSGMQMGSFSGAGGAGAAGGGGGKANQVAAWMDITGDVALIYGDQAKINESAVNTAKADINNAINTTKVTSNSFDSLMMDLANAKQTKDNYTRKDFQGLKTWKKVVKANVDSIGTSVKGFQATGNWVGAVIGGVAGLAGGLIGAGRAKRQARRQARLANQYAKAANQFQTLSYMDQAQKLRDQLTSNLERSYVAEGGLLNFGQSLYGDGGPIDYTLQLDYMNNYKTVGLNKTNILKGLNEGYQNLNLDTSQSFGFGGNLGTNGANFTSGLTYFDEGGRHEENPNQGIPLGIAPDGNPNLVEEGEVKWNKQEYIFSDRLKASGGFLEKYKLGQFADKTYAYIVKNAPVVKEANERPNDPTSQHALDAFLAALAEDQEMVKKEKEARELQEQLSLMSPEELAALGQLLEQQLVQQAQLEQQALLAQQPDDLTQLPTDYDLLQLNTQLEYDQQLEQLAQVAQLEGMLQPMMGACGGNLHAEGGELQDTEESLDPAMEQPMEEMPQEPQLEMVEQMPEETESPQEEQPLEAQETKEYKAADEMSTKELNGAIEEIIQFAILTKDRQLLREAKSVKNKGSREEKEQFVDEVHEEMNEMNQPQSEEPNMEEAQLEAIPLEQVPLEGIPQEMPQLELVMPEQALVMPEEQLSQMFAEGGNAAAAQAVSLIGTAITNTWNNISARDEAKQLNREAFAERLKADKMAAIRQQLLQAANAAPISTQVAPSNVTPTFQATAKPVAQPTATRFAEGGSMSLNSGEQIYSGENEADLLRYLLYAGIFGYNDDGTRIVDDDTLSSQQLAKSWLKKWYPNESTEGLSNEDIVKKAITLRKSALSEKDLKNIPEEFYTYTTPTNITEKQQEQIEKAKVKAQDLKDEVAATPDDDKDKKQLEKEAKLAEKEAKELEAKVIKEAEAKAAEYKKAADIAMKKAERDYKKTYSFSERQSHSKEFKENFLSQRLDAHLKSPNIGVISDQLIASTKKTFELDFNTKKLVEKYGGPSVSTLVQATANPFSFDRPDDWGDKDITKKGEWDFSTIYGNNDESFDLGKDIVKGNADGKIGITYDGYDQSAQGYTYNGKMLSKADYLKATQESKDALIAAVKNGDVQAKETLRRLGLGTTNSGENLYFDNDGNLREDWEAEYRKQSTADPFALNHGYFKRGTDKKTIYRIKDENGEWKQVYGNPDDYNKYYTVTKNDTDSTDDVTYMDLTGSNEDKYYVRDPYDPSKAYAITKEQAATMLEDGVDLPITTTHGNTVTNRYFKEKPEAERDKSKFDPSTLLRYAPMFNRPFLEDSSPAFMMGNSANNLHWTAAPDHREMLEYKPVDTLYRLNQLLQDANAQRRAIQNAGNGNLGLTMANLALLNAQTQQTLGLNLLESESENWNRYKDTVAANNQTNATYDLMMMQADDANMKNNSIIAEARLKQAQMLHEIDSANQTARSQALADKLSTLNKIGTENLQWKQLQAYLESGAAQPGASEIFGKKADGGDIVIRRKQRIKRFS